MKKLLPILLLILAPVFTAAQPAGKNALERGKAELNDGNVPAAVQALREAIQDPGTGWEAYFYLAVASFRAGEHAAAKEYAATALSAAPQAERERVQELGRAIDGRLEYDRLVTEADGALARGLIAKAAEALVRAYRAVPSRGEAGLRAASLFATRLGRLLDAAILWNQIAAGPDAASTAKASEELGHNHQTLLDLYAKTFAEAKAAQDATKFQRLAEAFLERPEPHLELASIAARAGDGARAASHLGEAVRLGTNIEAVRARNELLSLLEGDSTGAFKAFVADAFGSDMAAQLVQLHRDRTAEHRAAEAARESAARAARDQQEATRLRTDLRTATCQQIERLLNSSTAKEFTWTRRLNSQKNDQDTYSYIANLRLEGEDYILSTAHTQRFYRTGGSSATRADTVTEYRLNSFAALQDVKSLAAQWEAMSWHEPQFARRGSVSGPAANFRVMTLEFSGPAVRFRRNGNDGVYSYNWDVHPVQRIVLPIILGQLGDVDELSKLFRRLKEIDTSDLTTLRRLREELR